MHRPKVLKTTALLAAVVLFVIAAVVACENLPVADPGKPADSANYSLRAPEQDRHDIAIISVDFDPPLNKGDVASISLDKIALLVAVDNRGNKTERDLSVEARLMGEHENDLIEKKSQTIDALAPGEAKVIRFPSFSRVRPRSNYYIKVEVTSIAGEIMPGSSKLIRVSFEPRY